MGHPVPRFRSPRLRPHLWGPVRTLAIACAALAGLAAAQGLPSGEYGSLPLGGSVEAEIAAATSDMFQYHTYIVELPAGSGAVTVRVEGFGHDMDLAVKFGAPILTYDDVDFVDVSEEPNPVHTFTPSSAGTLYIDVLNLIEVPARYRLTVTAAGAGAPADAGGNPLGGNPLGGGGNGGNPLAAPSDPLLGTFEGDGLRVEVQAVSGGYQGTLVLGGQSFPFTARATGNGMAGSFRSGGTDYDFSATLSGDELTVSSGGANYRTFRSVAAPQSTTPAGGAQIAPTPSSEVLARGAHGALTRDDALAFVEALEFSLMQAGLVTAVTEEDRRMVLEALVQNYPTLQAHEQVVLSQARDVWSRVQANWGMASAAEREEFVLGVFVLAFGEQAVQQAIGGGGGAGGAGGGAGGGSRSCGTIDECMSTYAPEAYQDTMNAQSCWAAAGCSGYDPVDNSFSYDNYNY